MLKHHANVSRRGDLHITIKCTCKLLVTISSTTEPGDYFPVWLEDEDTACFIVHYNDVSITIHRNTFRAHELSRPNFGLKGKTQNRKIHWHDRSKLVQFRLYYRQTAGWRDIFVIKSFPLASDCFYSSYCVLHNFVHQLKKDCFLYVLYRVENLPPQQLSPNILLMRNAIIRFVCLDKLQHLSGTITNGCTASTSVPAV